MQLASWNLYRKNGIFYYYSSLCLGSRVCHVTVGNGKREMGNAQVEQLLGKVWGGGEGRKESTDSANCHKL